MAEEKYTISPNIKLLPTQDYEYLRKLGMAYIEQLGSDFWTDFNSHDPGVTTLEILAYALTELGYRIDFSMPDLLAQKSGEPSLENTLFSARQILTTHPISLVDYRKLLADTPKVANAWLAKATNLQPEIFAHCKEKELVFEPTDHPTSLQGVWDVLLELENSDEFGNVNAAGFNFDIRTGVLANNAIEFIAHQRPDFSWHIWLHEDCTKVEIAAWEKVTNSQWDGTLALTFAHPDGDILQKLDFSILGKTLGENPDAALKNVVKATGEETLVEAYLARERYVLSAIEQVHTKLHAHRNLCEDFRNIKLINAEEISFCADIDAAPEADLEEIEAQIILAIKEYLSPKVLFYNLLELQNLGKLSEEIFQGPKLDHGFILDEEIAQSELRTAVYTSDIINLIMDIDGVESVRNFVMSKFSASGQLLKKAEQWALNITPNHKPRYARSKSKWLFFKNKIPFVTRTTEVDDIMQLKSAEEARAKLLKSTLDLPIPEGNFRELDQHFSVQNDFPVTYAVSEEGFPNNATTERINKAKQMQGYLQFFDQVLADLLAQLQHFKSYISIDDATNHTYFTHFLQQIPGADYIYKNAAALEAILPEMAESEAQFYTRRNQILDHLLARFQEGFNNHVLTLYTQNGEEKAQNELIADKINFLKNYPENSARRFTAINILEGGSWPYFLSSGLKNRLSLLAGINQTEQRFLMPIRLNLELQNPPADDFWKIIWTTRDGSKKLFTSTQKIKGKDEAKRMARKAFQRFVEGGFNAVEAGSKFRIGFGSGDFEHKSNALFASANEALKEANELLNLLDTEAEGLNIFEHILLRPKDKNYLLMDACIPDDCKFCGDEDPYSFKLSIVLPYWPSRFRKMAYRRHIEELAHRETPAHLLPKICWADPFAWQELEDAFQRWLEVRPLANETLKSETTTRLIMALEHVETVYPEAVLHDCEDDRDENPVKLNQTRLGIF